MKPVFGSVMWVQIAKKERRKHDERVTLGIYMGVPKQHGKKTHKCYRIETKELVPYRHVETWDGVFLNQVARQKVQASSWAIDERRRMELR